MQVDFDPTQITFEQIVNLFWQSHNPIGTARNSQYKNAIWFADDLQLEVINSTTEPLVQRFEKELTTEVLPLETFYNAEDYHQKYCLQRHQAIMKSFNSTYPDFQDFINSTAAARLNGFSARQGSMALYESEKSQYGFELSQLADIVTR